jgi:hypothetical protein
MTATVPGDGQAAPLTRRQLRELERRRALDESGKDPNAIEHAAETDELDRGREGFAAPVAVDSGADGVPTETGRTELGYEEFTRELKLDQMLTRRELRALYEARAAERASTTESAQPAAGRAETDTAEAEPVTGSGPEGGAEPGVPGPEAIGRAEDEAHSVDAPESGDQPESGDEPESGSAPGSGDEPVWADARRDHSVEAGDRPAEPILVEVSSASHWPATDGDLAISTSSIVLPATSSNHRDDVRHALDSTGEIIVTGTIDLPRSLGATGADPAGYDSAEIDRVIDAADGADQVESGAAPVRAGRAVSTSASTRDVVKAPLRRRISLPVVLASTGGVLCVGVAALLVVALGMR